MPEISVIVPVYNVEQWIEQCVESIRKQTFSDLEIILVDDGSPDCCPEICDKYACIDNRIKVLHKPNGGLSSARNAGIDVAQGQYIIFIDSDDFISYYMIEKLYEAIKKYEADVAICGIQRVDQDGKPILHEVKSVLDNQSTWSQSEFWKKWEKDGEAVCVVTWNKIYKKEIFDEIRFDEDKLHEDVFILHKWVEHCNIIAIVSEKLYYYRQREGSIMHNNFTIRNLDTVEALTNRAAYFAKHNQQILAEKTMKDAMGRMVDGKRRINFSDIRIKKRYNELKNLCIRMNRIVSKNSNSKNYKTLKFLFILNENIYKLCIGLKKILGL